MSLPDGGPPPDDQASRRWRASPWRSAAASPRRSSSARSRPARATTSSAPRDLARAMVCECGMSEKLGPLAYGESEENVFLGRDMAHAPRGLLRGDGARDRRGGAPHRRRAVRARASSVLERQPRQARRARRRRCSSARRSTPRRSRPSFDGRELPAAPARHHPDLRRASAKSRRKRSAAPRASSARRSPHRADSTEPSCTQRRSQKLRRSCFVAATAAAVEARARAALPERSSGRGRRCRSSGHGRRHGGSTRHGGHSRRGGSQNLERARRGRLRRRSGRGAGAGVAGRGGAFE